MTRPFVLTAVLLASPAGAADLPVAPPPKPAAVKLAGVRLAPPGGKLWLTSRLVEPDAEGLRFSPDGRRLIADFDDGDSTGLPMSWDLRRPDRPPTGGPGRYGDRHIVKLVSPDARVAVGRTDPPPGEHSVWILLEPEAARSVRPFDPPEVEWRVQPLYLFSGDGRRFFAGRLLDPDAGPESWAPLTVWDTRTGKRIAQLRLTASYDLLALSHDGAAVFVPRRVRVLGAWFDCVGVWDVDTDRPRWMRPPLEGEKNDPRWSTTVFSADGARLITVFNGFPGDPILAPLRQIGIPVPDIIARVTDARTGRLIREVVGPGRAFHQLIRVGPEFFDTVGVPRAYAIAPDGRTAALADYDDTVYIWDLDRDRNVLRFRADGPIAAMTFSPDGRTLATCSPTGEAWLYPVPER